MSVPSSILTLATFTATPGSSLSGSPQGRLVVALRQAAFGPLAMKSYESVYAGVGEGVGVGDTDFICTQKLWSALSPIPNDVPPALRKRQLPL